jgi:hypothetical protein
MSSIPRTDLCTKRSLCSVTAVNNRTLTMCVTIKRVVRYFRTVYFKKDLALSLVCYLQLRKVALLLHSMVQDILRKVYSYSGCKSIAWFLYGIRRFITAFTKARHWTVSWASRIQFAQSISNSLRSTLMLSSYLCLGLPSCLLPLHFY